MLDCLAALVYQTVVQVDLFHKVNNSKFVNILYSDRASFDVLVRITMKYYKAVYLLPAPAHLFS